MSNAPVETKVQMSALAAAVGGVLVWIGDTYVFDGDTPDVVEALLYLIIPGVVAFVAGYVARHTPRTDPEAVPPPSPPAV